MPENPIFFTGNPIFFNPPLSAFAKLRLDIFGGLYAIAKKFCSDFMLCKKSLIIGIISYILLHISYNYPNKQKGIDLEIERNGSELILNESSLITSKTDLRGHITYANFDFIAFSGYSEEELIGSNHNIIRHPLMPRIIFKILWDTIKSGKEINAFVVNKNKEGLEYWVYANVTPSLNANGDIIGYYSVRRKPNIKALPTIRELYGNLTEIEKNAKAQGLNDMEASYKALEQTLAQLNMTNQTFFITMQHEGAIK